VNEDEWLSSIDPQSMLDFLHDIASDRKLRLLGVACLRASWNMLGDIRSRRAVEMTERFADSEVSASELASVESEAWDVRDELWDSEVRDNRVWFAEAAALTSSCYEWSRAINRPAKFDYPFRVPLPEHCDLMRDLFGNPFRVVLIDSSCLTSAVVNLAGSIYKSSDFNLLPNLANVIEEAGCDEQLILDHCRCGDNHARGCWVLDLILGKK
jgi:hypothetical protein